MPKIQLLPEELINKIAAGEVIERPASVVKELLENSLDAHASRILVEIGNFGRSLIKISDNGEGMDEEDARNSLLRHATSKIRDLNDLFQIRTLGFRGEALSSIAAVSRLSLTTKTNEQPVGFNLHAEGGKILSSGIAASETGTTVEIKDLFFNTPARKKFLKTDAVELKHIIEIVTYYALLNPKVYFKLWHNGSEVVSSPAVEDSRSKIATIYGTALAKELLEVDYQDEMLQVKGYLSKPYQARNDKTQQIIFVNDRWIRNEEITQAVYDAYHSLLFVNKHPVFVLTLRLDPDKVDVNVHPTKREIKIEQKELVYRSVFLAVRETLRKNNLIPELGIKSERQLAFPETGSDVTALGKESLPDNSGQESDQDKTSINPVASKYPFDSSRQGLLSAEKFGAESEMGNGFLVREESAAYSPDAGDVFPGVDSSGISPPVVSSPAEPLKLPPLKLLGQVHQTFFAAETPGGIIFIDQHVVQERVLYEQFMEQWLNQRVEVQKMLQGDILEFSPAEKVTVAENLGLLQRLGFLLEPFGENAFLLRTIPEIFGRKQPKEMVYEILEQLGSGKNRLEEIQEEIITRMACRASVKAGETVTIPEMQKLLDQLAKAKLPYTCPHGRAVLIKIPVEELEKKFRRK